VFPGAESISFEDWTFAEVVCVDAIMPDMYVGHGSSLMDCPYKERRISASPIPGNLSE